MEQTRPDISVIHLPPKYQVVEPDRRLPLWARRSNPIIRRQLGMYWKTILPEVDVLAKIVLVQVVLVLLTLPWPFLFDLALPTITAALILLPIALYLYGYMLLAVGFNAALYMVNDLRSETFDLVRATPITLPSILASKIAAALWRQVENLSLLMMSVALLSLPLLITQYASLYPLEQYPVLSRLGMVLGLVVSITRLALEPFMLGALGLLAGAALPVRSSAIITTAILGFFYFLLINMLRFVELAWPLRFLVDFALPLALPVIVTWGALRLTEYLLTRN